MAALDFQLDLNQLKRWAAELDNSKSISKAELARISSLIIENELTEIQRTTLALRVDKGLTYQEIGDFFGRNKSTAFRNYREAVRKLRRAMSRQIKYL